ncbi:MAG: NAD(P)-dependent oxidoreductase [Spirochaetota bacterium]
MQLLLFGATGGTGRRVLAQALDRGHTVTAVVRSPEDLGSKPEGLTVVAGDMADPEVVERAIDGAEAVIMAAGPVKSSPADLMEVTARNITQAMKENGTKRLVWLTGAGVMDERDAKSFSRRLIRGLMKIVAGKVLAGSERGYEIVKSSGLDYTVVRPPMLANDPGGKNLIAGYTPPKPIPVGRDDLATFLLNAAESNEYVGESPLLSYSERLK